MKTPEGTPQELMVLAAKNQKEENEGLLRFIELLQDPAWLGDKGLYPKMAGILERAKARVRELSETSTLLHTRLQFALGAGKKIRRAQSAAGAQFLSMPQYYANALASLGELSYELGAYLAAQMECNRETDFGYKTEEPVEAGKIEKARQEIQSRGGDFFQSFYDMGIAPKADAPEENAGAAPSHQQEEDTAAIRWFQKRYGESTQPHWTDLLKDREGFRQAAAESQTPLQDKYMILSVLLHRSIQSVSKESDAMNAFAQSVTGRTKEFGTLGNMPPSI